MSGADGLGARRHARRQHRQYVLDPDDGRLRGRLHLVRARSADRVQARRTCGTERTANVGRREMVRDT